MDLIFALFDVTSSRDVPFHKPQQIQCLYHGSTKAYLCSPLFSIPFSNLRYACYGFSVRLAVLAGVLLTLFFAWNVSQHV